MIEKWNDTVDITHKTGFIQVSKSQMIEKWKKTDVIANITGFSEVLKSKMVQQWNKTVDITRKNWLNKITSLKWWKSERIQLILLITNDWIQVRV